PVGSDHVAAVVTLPDGDPRAAVVLTTGGGGVPRSHRYRLWTQVARGLADRGIASTRMEWQGVGDSTGVGNFDLDDLPTEAMGEVAMFTARATGVSALGACGNCGGARTALRLAASGSSFASLALISVRPTAASRGSTAG